MQSPSSGSGTPFDLFGAKRQLAEMDFLVVRMKDRGPLSGQLPHTFLGHRVEFQFRL